MLNRSASLTMSTCVLKALPGKLGIKRHSPSILYISDTTIGYPTCHMCLKLYIQFIISTVESRQISNIHMYGFLLKCKKHLILPTDQSKSPKKRKQKMSWDYSYHGFLFNCTTAGQASDSMTTPM